MFRIKITETTRVPDTEQRWLLQNKETGNYGYVGAPEGATREVSREVLSQEVETLDLASVIRAINNL